MSATAAGAPIRTTVPARLDRLGWSRFPTRMVAGLGAPTPPVSSPGWASAAGDGIMMIGGVVEIIFGINAEGKSLETVTKPITAVQD